MKRLLLFVLSLFFFSITFADKNPVFQEYYKGNYKLAETGLRELATKNNGEALYYLATMYLNGYGVRKNFEKGFEFMIRSGEAKYLPAQLYLGNYYFQKKDLPKAVPWFKKAGDEGDSKAQLFTAISYLYGYGVKRNPYTARKYVIDAAKSGIPMAQYELAKIFLASKYTGDRRMGKIWLEKAASEHNYADAQYRLGMMLYTGDNIEENKAEGIEWIKKAASNGNQEAVYQLKELNGEKVKINNNEKNSKDKDIKNQEWQAMVDAMKKANLQFENPKIATAAENTLTTTPKTITLNKASIIKLNLNLAEPKDVPVEKILTYMTQLNYKNEKFELTAPNYPFEMPFGVNNYSEAFKSLSRTASYGNPQSLFKLAQMYKEGLGTKKNPETAFQLYLKSAEQNYLKAQYEVGLYYLQGGVVPQDPKAAMYWLTKAALRGSSQAQFVLGSLYETGIKENGGKIAFKNFDKAKTMYTLAVTAGLPVAAYRLAQLYASGLLNPEANVLEERNNLARAYKFYQQASKNGIADANIALGYFYAEQKGSTSEKEETFKAARKAASGDNPKATMLLAILYDRGIGTYPNKNKAIAYFKQLSKDDNAIAEFMLGTYYVSNGKKQDEGVKLLEKAANQGNGYAQYNLAILAKQNKYRQSGEDFLSLLIAAANHYDKIKQILADYYLMDNPVPDSAKKAAAIYQQLADKQDPAAELKLGFMNEHGIFFKKNDQKALEWYQKSANQGDAVAQFLLGNMYYLGQGVNRDVNQAIHWITKSAKQQYLPAEVGLGFIYEMDKHNYEKAKQWYAAAAKSNDPQAFYNLALIYEYGKGVEADPEKAFKLYAKAAQGGLPAAEMHVAGMYLRGSGARFEPNTALKLYQKAAERNNLPAIYALGLMSESGVAQDIDLNKARTYYEKAAQKGSLPAQLALGRFYEFGIDGSADKSKAIRFYEAAAREGNGFARRQLAVLSNQNKPSSDDALPYQCINKVTIEKVKNSFWKKITDWVAPVPNIDYMNAIDYLNSGEVNQGIAALHKIIKRRPSFEPARKTISYYYCE